MTRQKSIVIGAIAVSAMLLYALPAQNLASATDLNANELEFEQEGEQELAQRLTDETRQRIDQDARQRAEQDLEQDIDQELTQSNEANVDQSEENNQANVIETGDNTATTTQSAAAQGGDGGSGGDGGDGCCDDRHHKSYDSCDSCGSSGGSGGSADGGSAEAENEATTIQDSSADDNVQVNENRFGDDVALVDQDNIADQTAVNVGVQTQDQDINQYATNQDLTANVADQALDQAQLGFVAEEAFNVEDD